MPAGKFLEAWLQDRLFDVVPSAIAVIDAEWNVVRANPAFEERFGEWRGRRCFEVYKGLKRRCRRCPASSSFDDGKVRARQEIGVDRNGRQTHYLVQIAPVVRPDGSIPFLVEMSTDVTRQRQLKEQLDRANVLHRTIVQESGHGIVALDPRGRVTLWNREAEHLFGWEAGEVIGREPPAGVLPRAIIERLQRGEVIRLPETTARRKDDTDVTVACAAVPLDAMEDGVRLGSAAFFEDLTELKGLEREKLDAERLAAVGQTVAGLAHGVKNILTGLEGGLYLMRSGLDRGNDARLRDGFDMLNRNIARIAAFVRTLLDFSRGQTPVVRSVEPVALAEEAAGLFRDAAARQGIAVVVEAPAAVPPAALDPEALHSCLANLVTNAIDACAMSDRPERRVTVRVLDRPEAVRPGARPAPVLSSVLVFEVIDDGVGMEYEVKQKVFTNFFTTKGGGGTGLGLLVTRKIVQEHGGTLEVESTPGAGTTFRMSFPRRRLPPVAAGS